MSVAALLCVTVVIACSTQSKQMAGEGAASGAVAGAVGGMVSALVFGGDPAEGAARGAAWGASTGAVAGARALFPTLIARDSQIRSDAHAEEAMRKVLQTLMDIRAEYGMPRTCG